MARNWREIRADAIAQGRVDPARVDAARKEMHDAVQSQRLAEIRKALGHQSVRCRRPDGRLTGTGVQLESATCRTPSSAPCSRIVAALGGNLRIVADFGESTVELTG